ncbi:hypothetical protein CYY_000641 [Polysphondylium violaceum]|uniref:EGF-like domain-containing protein n=1 Tax=Polysphondylium violaceum TaxID=133409 RepID=A0A8J4V295_9MYCE|nr:hypothetical protein CYY_000641 [Polysphondylium violaceum]
MYKYNRDKFFYLFLTLALILSCSVLHAYDEIEPFIEYNYDACVFKHANYTIDLSNVYDISNPTLTASFDADDSPNNENTAKLHFNLCGQVNNQCAQHGASVLACASNGAQSFSERGAPYLKISDGVVSLGIPYRGINYDLQVTVGEKMEITFLHRLVSIKTPGMVVTKNDQPYSLPPNTIPHQLIPILAETTATTASRAGANSRMAPASVNMGFSILGSQRRSPAGATLHLLMSDSFYDSLPETLPAMQIQMYDITKYHHNCTNIQINRENKTTTCQDNPLGSEKIEYYYYTVIFTFGNSYGFGTIYYKAPTEYSRVAMTESDFDNCIFKQNDTIIDLSSDQRLYNTTYQLAFNAQTDILLSVCGSDPRCPIGSACLLNLRPSYYSYPNRTAFLSIDSEGTKLLVLFSNNGTGGTLARPYLVEVNVGLKNHSYAATETSYVFTPGMLVSKPLVYTVTRVERVISDTCFLLLSDTHVRIYNETFRFQHDVLGEINFNLCGTNLQCNNSMACTSGGAYGFNIQDVYILQDESNRLSLRFNFTQDAFNFTVEISTGPYSVVYRNQVVYVKTPAPLTLQDNLRVNLVEQTVPLLNGAQVVMFGDFYKVSGDHVVRISNHYSKRPIECRSTFATNQSIVCPIYPRGSSPGLYDLELYTNNAIGIVSLNFRAPKILSEEPFTRADYDHCVFAHKNYTIDLSFFRNFSVNISNGYSNNTFVLCGNNTSVCSGNYACGDNVYNERNVILRIEETRIVPVFVFINSSSSEFTKLDVIQDSQQDTFQYEDRTGSGLLTPNFKIYNTLYLTPAQPLAPRFVASTMRLVFQSLPINNLTSVSVGIYGQDNKYIRDCTQSVINTEGSYISCQDKPTGKELDQSTYLIKVDMGSYVAYSSISYYAPKEISRNLIGNEGCVFTGMGLKYTIDLSKEYTSTNGSYSIDDFNFNLCGMGAHSKCDSIACKGSQQFTERTPYLMVDEEAIKLLMVYSNYQGDEYSVEVAIGNSDQYINERARINTPFMIIKRIISFTVDPSITRETESTMTIKGDFVASLAPNSSISVKIFTNDGQYLYDATNIKQSLNDITCQVKPYGNESVALFYQVVVEVLNSAYGSNYFYFHPKSSPPCSHGDRDTTRGVCICAPGWVSFRCSGQQIYSHPSIVAPAIDQLNTGYQSPSADTDFTIDFNSYASTNAFGYLIQNTAIRSLSHIKATYGQQTVSFSSKSFKYDVVFSPAIAPNSTTVTVLVYDRVDVPIYKYASSMATIKLSNSEASDNVEAIFEISNSKAKAMYSNLILPDKNSISISGALGDHHGALFSVSPIYTINGQVSESLARVRILTARDASQLLEYKSTSVYVSVLVPSTPNNSDIFEIITTFNTYALY